MAGTRDSLSLSARPRIETGRHVHALRRAGSVPAVLYGHKIAPLALAIDAKELDRIWRRAGRTNLVDLHVDGQRQARKALIKDLQIHPRTGRPLHADFFAVNLREKITAEVPVIVVGDSPAVSQKVGQLQQVVSMVRIESLPADLPSQLTVDVSALVEIDQAITLAEVELPNGVALVHAELTEVVVKIAAVRVRAEEEVEAVAEGEAPAAAEGGGGEAEGGSGEG
jgi:large subunit ribosomal protein L25